VSDNISLAVSNNITKVATQVVTVAENPSANQPANQSATQPAYKVLHLTHEMDFGGTQQVIYQIVSGIDSQRFACSVLCIDGYSGAIGDKLSTKEVAVNTLQRQSGFDKKLILDIRAYLKAHDIDVLHCHQYTPYVYGVLAAIGMKVRVIFTEHGRFYPDRYSWKRRLINQILNRATFSITAISAATAKALVDYEWFPASAISVIYNGLLDSDESHPSHNSATVNSKNIVFGTVARLDPIKNHKMMLQAFSIVHANRPNTTLVIVGDGEERKALELQVRFTGFQTDTRQRLSNMSVFLLSSFSEGTSMTLLESMCLAKPCVVTEVGGNVELIEDKVSGLVVVSDDAQSFAKAMTELVDDENWRLKLGQQARTAYLEKFQLKHMVDAYQNLYQSAIDK